jgi:hypothetical protein
MTRKISILLLIAGIWMIACSNIIKAEQFISGELGLIYGTGFNRLRSSLGENRVVFDGTFLPFPASPYMGLSGGYQKWNWRLKAAIWFGGGDTAKYYTATFRYVFSNPSLTLSRPIQLGKAFTSSPQVEIDYLYLSVSSRNKRQYRNSWATPIVGCEVLFKIIDKNYPNPHKSSLKKLYLLTEYQRSVLDNDLRQISACLGFGIHEDQPFLTLSFFHKHREDRWEINGLAFGARVF